MITTNSLLKKPIGIMKESTVADIIKKMLEQSISRLVVREDGKAIGIITEKDLGFFLFNNKTANGLDKIPPDRLINKITYVEGTTSIQNCAKIMFEKNQSSLAVGSDANIEGIFTKTDLVKYYGENLSNKNKVVDFMTRNYISTHASASLSHVAEKMLEKQVSRLITLDQQNQPVGVISFRDFFRISLSLGSEEDVMETSALSGNVSRGFLSEGGFGGISQAKDVMTRGLISVPFHEDLADASKKIIQNRINGLGVLDGNGALAGIISKTDVIRALSEIN